MVRLYLLLFVLIVAVTVETGAETEGKRKELSSLRKTVRDFSSIDTNYIEPQHYNFTVY